MTSCVLALYAAAVLASSGPPEKAPAVLVPEGEPEAILDGEAWLSMEGVLSVSLSRDGKTLASGGMDGWVRLWDVGTRRELRRLEGHTSEVHSVAFHPDGETLASGGRDGTVRLWNTRTGRELPRARTEQVTEVYSVAFSPDGHHLAAGTREGVVLLWKWPMENEPRRLAGHSGPVRSVTFSPDSRTLASGDGEGTVRLWGVSTGSEKQRHRAHSGTVWSVAFSPDGSTLASGGSDKTVLWKLNSRETRPLEGYTFPVSSVAFMPDGSLLLLGGSDGTVRLWDVASAKELRRMEWHEGSVGAVAASPDGRTVVSGGSEGSIRLWDAVSGQELHRLEGNSRPVEAVAFSRDGKALAAASNDGSMWLWELEHGHLRQAFGTVRGQTRLASITFGADGRPLAWGGGQGRAWLWSSTPHALAEFTMPDDMGLVEAMASSPDGRTLAAGGSDGTVYAWEARSRDAPRKLTRHKGKVHTLAFSPDGRALASGGEDGLVRLCSLEPQPSCQGLKVYPDPGPIRAVAFSPKGRTLAVAANDQRVRLWDLVTGKLLQSTSKLESTVGALAFSLDGRVLALGGGDGAVVLWDVRTWRMVRSLREDRTGWVSSVAFSPDGRSLASAHADGTVRLWSTASDKSPPSTLRAARQGWLSQFKDQPVFRSEEGRFLYRSREDGTLEAVPPPRPASPPRLSATASGLKAPGDFGEAGELVLTVSNASDAGRAYWVHVEPVELPDGLVFTSSPQLLHLEPGGSEKLPVGLSYLRPSGAAPPKDARVRLKLVHAFGEEPPVEVPLQIQAPELVLVERPQVEDKNLSFTLKNIGTQATGPLTVDGVFGTMLSANQELLFEGARQLGPQQTIDLPPGAERTISISIPVQFLKARRFSFDIAANYERWPRTWTFSDPEVRVPVPYAMYGALALGGLLLFAGVHYVRVYRNPVVMQASAAPAQLRAWPLADMPKADHALQRANRRDSTITAAGIPLTRWERMLRGTRMPREAALAFAEALGGQLGAPLGARAWALSLPPLRLRFARDTALLVLDGNRLESGDAERAMTDVFQDGRGPSQVLVLDRTHAQNAAQVLCDTPRVRSVVLSADRLRDLLLADEPIRLLETTIAQQISVSELSPYQVAGGVKLEHLFFGRERELRAIVDRSLRNFLVVGQRQMGKSTLLLAVLRRLQARGDVDATYLELADADLHRRLVRERGALPSGAPLPPFVEVAAGTPGRPRVWLIDEADDFIRTDARADYPVVKAMRALAEEGRAYFILAGFWDLYRAVVLDEQQPLRNFGEHLRLEPLDARSALALVTEPMAALGLEWDAPTTTEYLLEQAGRRANLLVLACKALVESLPADTRVLTREHLERVLREDKDLRDQGRRWRGDHPLHRAVVRQALLLGRPTREEVRQALKARGADVRATDFDEAMDHRELSYVLVPDGEGRLYCPVPLMQRYIESERGLEAGLGEDLEDLRRGFSDVPPPA